MAQLTVDGITLAAERDDSIHTDIAVALGQSLLPLITTIHRAMRESNCSLLKSPMGVDIMTPVETTRDHDRPSSEDVSKDHTQPSQTLYRQFPLQINRDDRVIRTSQRICSHRKSVWQDVRQWIQHLLACLVPFFPRITPL